MEWNTNQEILEKEEYFLVKLDKNNIDNNMKNIVFIWNLTFSFDFDYSFIILDSNTKYLPDNLLMKQNKIIEILLNNFNYDDLKDNENYYLYIKYKTYYDLKNIIGFLLEIISIIQISMIL